MINHSYLVFSLDNHFYGIETAYVEEILLLPELTVTPEAPPNVVGILNLRGDRLPVLDLHLSSDAGLSNYRLTDSIVVLRQSQLRVGIIVNAVHGIKDLSPEEITTEFPDNKEAIAIESEQFLAGIVDSNEPIFLLQSPSHWLQLSKWQQLVAIANFPENGLYSNHHTDAVQFVESETLLTQRTIFLPHATPEERAVFRQRANSLKQLSESQSPEGLKTLAVIDLNDQLFGIDLEIVREFIDIRTVTPIPCCPPHIIGNMNLRGEILVLVDIHESLNLPQTSISNTSKAIVVEIESGFVGIVVQEIRDAMFVLNPQEIKEAPATTSAINQNYLQGVASYNQQLIYILNLPEILLKGELVDDDLI